MAILLSGYRMRIYAIRSIIQIQGIQRNRPETITKPTVREVVEEFTQIPLIDGKTFWELENELEWV